MNEVQFAKELKAADLVNFSDDDITALEELISEPTEEDPTAQIEGSPTEQTIGSVLPQAANFSSGLDAILGRKGVDTINDSEGWDGRFGDSLFSKGVELLAKQMNRALSVLEAMDINGIASMMARGFLSRLDRNNENSLKSNLRNTVGIDLQGQIRAEGLISIKSRLLKMLHSLKVLRMSTRKTSGKLLRDNVMNGERPSNIVTQIKDIGNVTKSRAKLIARTETAKANTDITQLRSEALGAKTYVWSASMDERTRTSHAILDGKLCRFDDDTVYSDDDGLTWKPRSKIGGEQIKPGKIWNCRCVMLPIVTWS